MRRTFKESAIPRTKARHLVVMSEEAEEVSKLIASHDAKVGRVPAVADGQVAIIESMQPMERLQRLIPDGEHANALRYQLCCTDYHSL